MIKFTTNYSHVSETDKMIVIRGKATTTQVIKSISKDGVRLTMNQFEGMMIPVDNSVVLTKQQVIKLVGNVIDLVDKAMMTGYYLNGNEEERASIIRQVFTDNLSYLKIDA